MISLFALVRWCLLILICSSWIACNSNGKPEAHIPKDAMMVFRLHTSSIAKKAAWNLAAGNQPLDELFPWGTDSTSLNFQQTGVDPRWPIYAYTLPDQRLPGQSKLVVLIPLLSKGKFETFLQSLYPGKGAVNNGSSRLLVPKDNLAIGWEKNMAVLAISAPAKANDTKPYSAAGQRQILSAAILQSLQLEEQESITQDTLFDDWLVQAQDLGVWVNVPAWADGSPTDDVGSLAAILAAQPKLIHRSRLLGGLQFDDGKITGMVQWVVNDTAKAILEALHTDTIDPAMSHKIQGQQLNLFVQLQLNASGLRSAADSLGALPLAGMLLREIELHTDDVFQSLGGAFQLAVTDLGETPEHGNDTKGLSPRIDKHVFFSFSLNSMTHFEKVLQALKEANLIVQNKKDKLEVPGLGYLFYDQHTALIANQPSLGAAFLPAIRTPVKAALPDAAVRHQLGVYVDIYNSLQHLPPAFIATQAHPELFAAGRNLFSDFLLYSGDLKNNRLPFYFELNFKQTKQNSFVQLVDFAVLVLRSHKEQPAEDQVP